MRTKLVAIAAVLALLLGSTVIYLSMNPPAPPPGNDDSKFVDLPPELNNGLIDFEPEVIDLTPGHPVGGVVYDDYLYIGFQNMDGYVANMYYVGYINNTAIDIIPESKQIAQGGELHFEKTEFDKTTVTTTINEIIKNPAKTSKLSIASSIMSGVGTVGGAVAGVASVVAGVVAAPVTGGLSVAAGVAIGATVVGGTASLGALITGEIADSKTVTEKVKTIETQTIEERMKSYTIGSKISSDHTIPGHTYAYGAIGDLEIIQLEIYDKEGKYVDTTYTYNTLDFKGYGWIDYSDFLSQKTIEVKKIQESKVKSAYAERLAIYKTSPIMNGSDAAHPIYLDKSNFYEKFVSSNRNGYYKLTEDIDWNASWNPVGTPKNPFVGGFDGSYYNINGLYVVDKDTTTYKISTISKNTNEYNFAGMFEAIESAEICNINFINPIVKQKMYSEWNVLAVAVGWANNSSIHDIYISGGTVAHTNNNPGTEKSMIAGGVVGIMTTSSKVEDCVVQGLTIKINGKIAYAGEIVGSMESGNGLVSHCVALNCEVQTTSDSKDKSDDSLVGLVGAMKFSGKKTIEYCFVKGTHRALQNDNYAAALVGWIFESNGSAKFTENHYVDFTYVYGSKKKINDSEAMYHSALVQVPDKKNSSFYQNTDIVWENMTYTLSWRH